MKAKTAEPLLAIWQTQLKNGIRCPRRESLKAAFTALGLDRVVAGTRALYKHGGWDACFLALAYGEPGELEHLVFDESRTWNKVSQVLGISDEHVKLIVEAFDFDRKHFERELTRWLEGAGVNAANVLANTRREVVDGEWKG